MKILFVHNWYGSSAPSGENAVVTAEMRMLRDHGCEVVEYFRYSDDIRSQGLWGKIKGGLATPFNPFSYFSIRKRIRTCKPDVIHVHNFFPLISPAVFYAASHENTPLVMTLHNYRIGCAGGLPFRDISFCVACIESKSVWPAIANRCYRGSLPATLPMAIMISLHRRLGTWLSKADLFIVLNEFQGKVFSSANIILPNSFRYKPQFMSDPPKVIPWKKRLPRAIYIGRMSYEKGVDVLLESWRLMGKQAPELVLVGAGPELSRLNEKYPDVNVRWLGQLDSADVLEELKKSKLLIFPSICFEGFPMVIREALACGVPVLSSDCGPLKSIIKSSFGRQFESGNYKDLVSKFESLWQQDKQLEGLASYARIEFTNNYTAEINFRIIMNIYQEAIEKHAASRRSGIKQSERNIS